MQCAAGRYCSEYLLRLNHFKCKTLNFFPCDKFSLKEANWKRYEKIDNYSRIGYRRFLGDLIVLYCCLMCVLKH
jgi:hypothetical protein